MDEKSSTNDTNVKIKAEGRAFGVIHAKRVTRYEIRWVDEDGALLAVQGDYETKLEAKQVINAMRRR